MQPRIKLVERHRMRPRMDITALVDCVFLLLVFFLLTSTFVEQRNIGIELTPVTTGERAKAQDTPLEIHVTRDGLLLIDDIALDKPSLLAHFQDTATTDDGRAVRILADDQAPAGHVVFVLDTARAAGLSAVDLVGKAERIGDGAP